MKAIILCAWEWKRLRPLTENMPKPGIKIFWKPILEHILETISGKVNEVEVIVKYKWEKLEELVWNNLFWTKILYKNQWNKKWTWWALEWISSNEDILIMNGDTIFNKKDLEKIIKSENESILVKEVENPEKYWIFLEKNWFAEKIIEKPSEFIWNLANLWVYKFKKEFLKEIEKIEISERWEYEITDAINSYLKSSKIELIEVENNIIDITYPWDILSANKTFLDNIQEISIKWEIEEWVTIKWNLIVWENTIIKSGTYIEWNVKIWDNCVIWPNTFLRDWTVIWNNSKVWNAVEIKNTQIWDYTNIAHLSYIWDSVIWNNVNIWGWFITWNLRHDWWNIRCMSNWELVDTWRRKLWIIMWDNVKTGINSSCYPGRVLESWSFTMPWEIIK